MFFPRLSNDDADSRNSTEILFIEDPTDVWMTAQKYVGTTNYKL